MVDVMIEQWKNRDGSADFLWSVWQAGSRLHMGGSHASADEAEKAARAFCVERIGSEPTSVTRL